METIFHNYEDLVTSSLSRLGRPESRTLSLSRCTPIVVSRRIADRLIGACHLNWLCWLYKGACLCMPHPHIWNHHHYSYHHHNQTRIIVVDCGFALISFCWWGLSFSQAPLHEHEGSLLSLEYLTEQMGNEEVRWSLIRWSHFVRLPYHTPAISCWHELHGSSAG